MTLPLLPCPGCSSPASEGEAMAQDAARYRFLRDHARPTDPSRDGSFNWYVPSLTFDETVDRSMGQEPTNALP